MNVEEKVKAVLCELSGTDIIGNDASLQEDLALDSLSMVALLLELEEAFDIELDESDMNPFDLTTVQSVINMINKYCCGEKNEEDS